MPNASAQTPSRMVLRLRVAPRDGLARRLLLAAFLLAGLAQVVALYHLWPAEEVVTYERPTLLLPAAAVPAVADEPETLLVGTPSALPSPVLLSLLGAGMIGLGVYRRRRRAG